MYGHSDRDLSLNKSIRMWNNIPVDGRLVTGSLNELDDRINFPYVGMIFYSEFEDKYYKVLSIEDGYRVGRTGKIVRKDDIPYPNPMDLVPGYFVGNYEEYVNGGSGSIERAYIDNHGDLHLIYVDGRDENIGHVKGQDGHDGAPGQTGDTGNGIEYIDLFDQIPYGNVYRAHYTNGDHYDYTVNDGSPVEMRLNPENKDIEWKLVTEEIWNRIINADELKGPKGEDGADGQDGRDGTDGIGIQSISKTATEGLVDSYTITFTDGNTTIFTVTNGADGQDGAQGEQGPAGQDGTDGEDGSPVQIRLNDTTKDIEWKLVSESENDWHLIINANDLKGPKGEDGTDGQDGTDGIGITGIEKTSTEGLVDIYTITFTDGSTATFTVTNGSDGQDGTDGRGIKSVAIETVQEEPNHLMITYTDDTTIDAGVINVSGSEQTIDADENEVIVGDGNDWAKGSKVFLNELDFKTGKVPPTEYLPEVTEGFSETRLSVTNPTSEMSTKQLMLTNQVVGDKTPEELTNEDKTSYSYNNRKYKSDYYHLIMKDGAKVIAGGDTEVDLTGDNLVRMHGGVVAMDDNYGLCNPYVGIRGNATIIMEGLSASDDPNDFVCKYTHSATIALPKSVMDDPSVEPTMDEIINNPNSFVRDFITTRTSFSDSGTGSTEWHDETNAGLNYINNALESADTKKFKYSTYWSASGGKYVSSQNITKDSEQISCYVISVTYQNGDVYTRPLPSYPTIHRNSDTNMLTYYPRSIDGLYSKYNSCDCLLKMRHLAVIDMENGAVIRMRGSSYINMEDDVQVDLNGNARVYLEKNANVDIKDAATILVDGENTLSFSTTRPYRIGAPVCMEWDGDQLNIGPLAVNNSTPKKFDKNYIYSLQDMQKHYNKGDLDTTCSRSACHPLRASYTSISSYFRNSTARTFTRKEIEQVCLDRGDTASICIYDNSEHIGIPYYIWQSGIITSKPENTASIIQKLANKGITNIYDSIWTPGNNRYHGCAVLIPKVGKARDCYDFITTNNKSFDTSHGYVRPNNVLSVKAIEGWDALFDEVILFKNGFEEKYLPFYEDPYYNLSYSDKQCIYLTPITTSMPNYANYNTIKSLNISTNFNNMPSEVSYNNASAIVPSRVTSTSTISTSVGNLDLFFTKEAEDTYRANANVFDLLLDSFAVPSLKIFGDSNIDISGESRKYINMTGNAGDSTNIYIQGSTFIQYSGRPHQEIHDDSTFIMRGRNSYNPWQDYAGPLLGEWENWTRPVKKRASSPSFGMYDEAQFHMSSVWLTDYDRDMSTFTFTSTTTSDPNQGLDQQAIDDLNVALKANNVKYSKGGTVTTVTGESGDYTITLTDFKIRLIGPDWWSRYPEKSPNSPILIMSQNADVRVHDNSKLLMDDSPDVTITGKSIIEIGENGADYSANAKFWNEHPAGPEIKIKGAAHIEMLGKANESESDNYAWGVPSVSMRGNCLIDMCDTLASSYSGQAYQSEPVQIRRGIYNELTDSSHDGTGIFAARNYLMQNAPILQMKGRSIISVRDESLLRMAESSFATFEGNAYFKVSGGGYTGSYSSTRENDVFQHAEFNAGTVFVLDGNEADSQNSDKRYGVFAIVGRQIILSNEGKKPTDIYPSAPSSNPSNTISTEKHGRVLESIGALWNSSNSWYNPTYSIAYGSGHAGWHTKEIFDTYSISKLSFVGDYSFTTARQNIPVNNKQSVLLEGTTKAKLGGNGIVLMDIGGEGSSYQSLSFKSYYGSTSVIDYGVKNSARFFKQVLCDDGSQSVFKFEGDSGSNTNIYLHGQGESDISINLACTSGYDPSGMPSLGPSCFGMNFSPRRSDIEVKWGQLQAIWDGYRHFIQVDGETHFENWSGKFITRTHQPDIFKPTPGIGYPKWNKQVKADKQVSFTYSFSLSIYTPNEEPTTPTAQELYDLNTNYFTKTLLPTGWNCTYTYDTINNITVGDHTSGDSWYYDFKLKNYRVKEKYNFTFKFDDATEYTTFEDLQAAIAANPEKIIFNYRSLKDRVIGLYSGTLSSHTAVDGIWEYTVANPVTIRDWTEWVDLNYFSSRDDDTLFPIVNGGYNDQTYSYLKTKIQYFHSYARTMYYLPAAGSSGLSTVNKSDYTYTDAIVSAARVRSSYSVTGNAVYTGSEVSDGVDWFLPSTQQSQILAANNKDWNKAPIVQLTGTANISIREKFNTATKTYTLTTSNTYDTTDQQQAITDFIGSGQDYDDFIAYIGTLELVVAGEVSYSSDDRRIYTPELWNIISIEDGSTAGEYIISFTIKPQGWNEHIESTADSPVVEITDDSEVRFYDGSRVKGYRPQFGETTYEFSSSDPSEEPVTFTLSQLKALKALLN